MRNTYLRIFAALFLITCLVPVMELEAKPTNKKLIIGITQEFETMNPLIMTMAASHLIYYFAGQPLISINADWKWECYLCTNIPTVENGLVRIIEENGKKKVLANWEIKAKAKWGDGKPVTGHDVRLSWLIGRSPNVMVPEKDIFTRIEDVQVDPKNPKKFMLKFHEPRYDHYQLATLLLVPHHLESGVWRETKDIVSAYEKQTRYTTDPLNPGLYSGPYRIAEVRLGSHMVLVPNPHFFGEAPKIQKIIFKLIPNTQTLEANLLSGTIDMICELGMTMDQALDFDKRIQKDRDLRKRFEVRYRQGMTYEHIDLNLRNPLLKDIRVRRALVHAIDRDRLVKALFDGRQKKAIHNTHPLDPYFSDDVMKYPHDPKKAEQLLEEAGWKKRSDGIRMKNGKKLAYTLMTTAQNKTREQVQVFLQHEWKKVGVVIKIKNEPARVYFGETVRKARYEAMAMYAFISSPDNPPRSTLHSSEIPTRENSYSGQNRPGFRNARVDRALDAILTEFSFDKRKEHMKIVQQEYAKDVPVIPLYMRADIAVIPKNLVNFRITGHQFYSSLNASRWSLR